MNYCENCNIICQNSKCHICGKRKLREVQNDDFCYLARLTESWAENFKRDLEEQEISCALIPYGNGVNSYMGLSLGSYRIFVKYQNLQKAQQMLSDIVELQSANLKKILTDKLDEAFIDIYSAKRLRKTTKMDDMEILLQQCKKVIEKATYVADHGPVSTGFGDYFFVQNNDAQILVNSATMEILSVKFLR